MSEEWREVSGTDGRYQISNMGRLRKNYKRRPSRIFLGHKSSYGYVSMSVDGRKVFRHVLIARAFHGDPLPGQMVRHLNGKPGDDRIENLRWGTPKENAEDSKRHGTNYALNKTHCKWGHEFSTENTFIDNQGRRICRTCKRRHMHAGVAKISEQRRLAREMRRAA